MSVFNRDDYTLPENLSVLLLEDHADIRELIIEDLHHHHIFGSFLEASNIKDALDIIQDLSVSIDIMLIDWTLPDGSGLDLVKAARDTKRFKETPIIMITARDDVNDMMEAVSSGSNDYVIKPWNETELAKKFCQILSKNK